MPIPFILGGIAIAAGAFGAKKGYDAYCDNEDAKSYTQRAKRIFENSQEELNDKRKATNKNLNDFGEYKKSIFENEINKFLSLFSQIKNFKVTDNTLDEYEFQNNEISFEAFKKEVFNVTNLLGSMSGSAVAGAAATNATLAWLGGGSLAAGGFGVAGGTMVLGGLVAGPALAVAGWVLSAKAEEAKNEAYSNLEKARSIKAINDTIILKLNKIVKMSNAVRQTIQTLNNLAFKSLLIELELFLIKKSDHNYNHFSEDEKEFANKIFNVAKTIKNLLVVPILTKDGEIDKKVQSVLKCGEELIGKLAKIDEKYR
ncbi:MAG: hypothetical protein ACTTIM_00495 [Campylobacter sp.]